MLLLLASTNINGYSSCYLYSNCYLYSLNIRTYIYICIYTHGNICGANIEIRATQNAMPVKLGHSQCSENPTVSMQRRFSNKPLGTPRLCWGCRQITKGPSTTLWDDFDRLPCQFGPSVRKQDTRRRAFPNATP